MNNAYLRAVEQVADRIHNGNQNQQQYHSKDKPGRSPKENMGYRSLENKPSENPRIKCVQMNRFIMLLSNMATRELWKTTIMDNNNDISHSDAKSTFADHERKQIKEIFNVWSDFIKLPTIGPFQAFSKDSTFYSQELFNLFQTLIQLQTNTRDYWTQMNNAYLRAVEQVADRMHNGNQNQQQYHSKDKPGRSPKENMEEYRKTIIDAFEEAFTDLFSSNDFGIINSNLISSQLDVVKHLQNIAEKNFKTLNLPTRSEVDELSKDVHEIKREIHDIKKKIGII